MKQHFFYFYKVRFQAEHTSNKGGLRYNGIFDATVKILKQEGVSSFYKFI